MVIQNDNGQSLVIVDYFRNGEAQDLMAADKGVLRGHVVESLAGAAPDARLAQTSPTEGPIPIGQVEVAEGSVRVQRGDGTVEELDVGVKIYQRDVLITDVDGNLSVTFADGTIFTLSASSRMVVDELIYDPESTENSGAFSLVQGGFVFVAGQVAKTGGMTVDTPAATMGIRGTNVSAKVYTVGGETEVQMALNKDFDGTLSSIEVYVDDVLQGVITTDTEVWVVSTADGRVERFPRTIDDQAADQELIDEAYEAYLAAQDRIAQGQNYVEQEARSGNIQRGTPSDNNFNDLPENSGPEEQQEGPEGDENLDDGFDDTNLQDDGVDNLRDPEEPPVANDITVTGLEDASGSDPIRGSVLSAGQANQSLTFGIESAPQNGQAVINELGEFIYIPNPDFAGQDVFTYSVSNGADGFDTATVTINVAPVNDAPEAKSDQAQTAEDMPVVIDPLTNDFDVDGDSLQIVSTTLPANGSVAINSDNTLTYTPKPNFNGVDRFTYKVEDGQGGSDSVEIVVTVSDLNDQPVAGGDSISTNEDQPITFDPRDNDTDADGDPLFVTKVSDPANGSVIINVDGTLTYTPDPNFNGMDSFTYVTEDGNGGSNTATVSVSVGDVNDAPVAANDPVTTNEDQSITFDPRGNDNDPDSNPLSVSAWTDPANGNVVLNPDGTLTYTPNPNFSGSDSFTYTVQDGQGGSASAEVSVTVSPVNDQPVLGADFVSTAEDQPVTFDPRGNDSDTDGDVLQIRETSTPVNGNVIINIDGGLTYTPNADFNGTDSFTYTVVDGRGGTATGTVNVTVSSVNDPPVATLDAATTNEDQAVTFNPLTNDMDPDGNPLSISGTSNPSNGSVAINPDGTLTYTPNPNFNGTDTFSYTVSDGQGGSATAQVSVFVGLVNDPPVAADDTASTLEDQAVTFDPRGNDVDLDGDPLSVTGTSTPANGSVSINANGTLTYTPNANFNGTDNFTYTVNDGQGASASATATVTVILVNDLPVTVDDASTTSEDQAITFDPTGNDSDPDGDPLTITGTSVPSNGAVAINSDGTLTYTPNADFNGTDSFTYTVNDGQGGLGIATVNVTVTPVNDLPVATNDEAATNEDQAVTFDPRTNDSDVDEDPLTISGTSMPANGSVAINPDNTLTYTPDAHFNGADSFTYTVSDGQGGTSTATVNVTIAAVNDLPVAVNDIAATNEDQSLTFDPRDNDSDIDGDPLTITSTTAPANGSVAINPNGTLTYTPDADFSGSDSFTYTVNDGQGGIATATVDVTIAPVNDPPLAADDTASTNEDQSVTFDPRSNDSDADGDPLSVSGTSTPSNGSVSVNANGSLTYTPDANFNGTDSFTYTVSDGQGGTDTATVNITIVAVNDPPVAADDTVSTNEDQPVTFEPRGNDSDIDGNPISIGATSTPSNGSVVINANGTLTYTPDANYNGADSFTYTVSDGQGGTDTATVDVTVTASNDPPEATNDNVTTAEDQQITFDPRDNDSDLDGDPLTITGASNPANGSTTVNAGGSITYSPDANFNGNDSFTYTISDGQGGTDTGTIQVTVTAVNDNPDAVSDTASTNEDQAVIISPLGNDSDVDGDTLTVSGTSTPANGSVTINSNGTLTYTPDADFAGNDSFTYTIQDGQGGSDTATVSVSVAPVNDPPIASNDSRTTNEDQAVTFDPRVNDSDADGNTLTITGTTIPTNGSVVINANGTLTYTPDANFNGQDSFGYTLEDGQGGSDTATVQITVNPVNDDPVANDDARTTDEDQPITFDPRDNDSDIDGNPLSISAITVPASSGLVSVNPDGQLTYTPNPGFFGTDSFTYELSDGQGGTDTATVTITVNEVNEAPTANPDLLIAPFGSGGSVVATANDTDPDGDSLNVISVSSAQNGSSGYSGGTVTYTPNSNFFGLDSFSYTVSDGTLTDTSTVTVVVEQDPSSLPPDFPVTISFDPNAPGNVPGKFDIDITSVQSTNINLVFAMDSSGSIGQAGWNTQVSAVRNALVNLASDFSGSQTNVDVYIINYATNVQTVGKFNLVSETSQLLSAVDSLPYQSGGTNWEGALNTANSFFGSEPSGEVNIMYFITDGNPFPANQNWQGALSNLNSSHSVDIEAFAIGNGVNLGNLNIVDSDGSATSVTNAGALEAAFGQTPLFNAQLIDFSLRHNADGIDLGEIADENSPSLTTDGINFDLALADIPGLQGNLGDVNVFSVYATFDLDGNLSTTGDQVEVFSVGTLTTSAVAGVSASSSSPTPTPTLAQGGSGLVPLSLTLSGDPPPSPGSPPEAQQLQGVLDLSGTGGNLPTGGGGQSGGGAMGATGFTDSLGGQLPGLSMDPAEAPSMPSA
ncbi:Ig-like domain-containing protein [Primorskyibacter sp. S87]|uniref:Ig-like domain-containing protein n=1 Tax=Primorskyibacter sp. S87 TaxID=3415126 RepID=UPI003C7B5F0E